MNDHPTRESQALEPAAVDPEIPGRVLQLLVGATADNVRFMKLGPGHDSTHDGRALFRADRRHHPYRLRSSRQIDVPFQESHGFAADDDVVAVEAAPQVAATPRELAAAQLIPF